MVGTARAFLNLIRKGESGPLRLGEFADDIRSRTPGAVIRLL